MRHSIILAGLLAGLLAAPVFAAESKIVVADSQAALMNSEAAKKVVAGLQAEMKVQRDRMVQLKGEIEALEAKAQKNGPTMSDKDKKDLQKLGEGKFQEYNNLAQTVKERTQEAQNALLQKMIPKMEAIIDNLQKTNHYDIIIEKKNVIFADPAVDLTKKITEMLNASK
jgi:outer membrane protein